jgi:hypothetical protein
MERQAEHDDPASRPDQENPEWTADDFRLARPALEMIAEVFGPAAAESYAPKTKRRERVKSEG